MNSCFHAKVNALIVALASAGAALSAGATAARDPLVYSNTGTSHEAGAANNTFCTFRIPPTAELPQDTVVVISSISVASRNATWNPDVNSGDAVTITLVGADGVTVRSDVATGFDGTIAVNESTEANRVTYTFSTPVRVGVGRSYDATLCHSNGNPLYWSDINNSGAGLRMVRTADADSVLSPKRTSEQFDLVYYPVYEISGYVSDVVPASVVNAFHEGEQNVVLTVPGGTVVNGDVAFSATKVSFVSNGSVAVRPPAGNAAEFDFSGVAGDGMVEYVGSLPSVSGDAFTATTVPTWVTDGTRWTNIIALCDMAITGPNFNNYGNPGSVVMLSGVAGWVNTGVEYTTPIVLENGAYDFALKLTNGNSPQETGSNTNRCSVFSKVSGGGVLTDAGINEGAVNIPHPVIKVYDFGGFTGDISLKRGSVVVCDSSTVFGDTLYNLFVANSRYGAVYVAAGKSVDIADGGSWTVRCFSNYGSISGSGAVTVSGLIPNGAFTNDSWSGTLSISNVASASPLNVHLLCSPNSTLALTSVGAGGAYLAGNVAFQGRMVLSNDGVAPALALNNGLSSECTTIHELAGDGALSQSNSGIFQGLAINVMTNFTGTIVPANMIVTFGTTTRHGRTGGEANNKDTMRRLYIDPDAVLSVPAGFELWNPVAFVINGPVDFTTSATDYNGLVLFSNTGSDVSYGDYAAFSVNGVPLDTAKYSLRRRSGQLVLRERQGKRITIR